VHYIVCTTTTTTVYIYLLVKLDCPFLITWRLDLSVCCPTISFFLFRKIGLGWWCSSIISMALSVSEQAGLQLRRWLAKLCQKKNGGKDNKGGDAPKEARAHLSPGLLARRTIRRCRACLQENNQIKGWSWLQRPKPKKEATRRAVSPPPPHHPCMPCTASNAVAAIALSLSLRYSMR
jgi:hypothetical protein